MKTHFLNKIDFNENKLRFLAATGLDFESATLSYYTDSRNRNKLKLDMSFYFFGSFWIKTDSLIVTRIDFESNMIDFSLYAGIDQYINDLSSKIYQLNQ
nr:hypothetical protein [uncultured Carboxylicivirga sp.]